MAKTKAKPKEPAEPFKTLHIGVKESVWNALQRVAKKQFRSVHKQGQVYIVANLIAEGEIVAND